MKYLALFTLCLLLSLPTLAQQQPEIFSPIGLTNGTSLIGRSVVATTLSDTTAPIKIRGYADVFIVFKTAANDSVGIQLAGAFSADGVNYGAYTALDSMVATGTVINSQSYRLTDKYHGFYSMKLRVYSPAWAANSAAPVATVTTQIVRYKYPQ